MDHGKFPSLGGVAVAERLTGWFVTSLHEPKTTTPALRATPPKEGNYSGQQATQARANPPRPVSLYLVDISAPISIIDAIT